MKQYPPSNFGNIHIADFDEYKKLYEMSIDNPDIFWAKMAEENVSWYKKWEKVSDCCFDDAKINWFKGAKLNLSYNCIDRHAEKTPEKIALIGVGNSPDEIRKITYKELLIEVSKFSNVLKSLGIKKGDRVAIYMPMIIEAAIAMLACTRIGAVHSVIFGGFSAESIKSRVLDAQCSILITATESYRGNKKFELKKIVDTALKDVECIKNVVVFENATSDLNSRDLSWQKLMEKSDSVCPPEVMDANDSLFILYTSGSTGKPKGVVHSQAGYLVHISTTHKYVFGLKSDDIFFCAADIGWITGHSYVLYAPLCNGVTSVMFESLPTFPDAGRYWQICEKLKVTIFYTAPTAIRSVAKEGWDLPKKYDLTSLRVLGSVGEPINQDAWEWYYNNVGNAKCSIVDTWWQTETGGMLITPIAGVTPMKPGSASFPFFGINPVVLDDNGNELVGNNVSGKLCIKSSWPGQMTTVYGDHERFKQTYFSTYKGYYFTGDACTKDSDGFFWITGRVDDVLNVSGHRLGTAEIESALVHSGILAEAAVVGFPHDIKGTAIAAFCIVRPENKDISEQEIINKIKNSVRENIGAFASPDYIQLVSGLPRTRSGKIMRRILRKIVHFEQDSIGDISTLSEPNIVSEISEQFIKNFDQKKNQ
jgi:acetyl-CoA synthetase